MVKQKNNTYMTRLFFLLACCLTLLISTANAQLRKIPAEATTALKEKFPNAQKVEWKDKLTYFEANFEDNGVATTATFSNKGDWQQTERGLTYEETPDAVKDGFKKSKYASADDWKMGETVTKIVKSDDSVLYRVYVDKVGGIQKKYLYFNTSGQLEKETLTL
jgi:hypothetical protein